MSELDKILAKLENLENSIDELHGKVDSVERNLDDRIDDLESKVQSLEDSLDCRFPEDVRGSLDDLMYNFDMFVKSKK